MEKFSQKQRDLVLKISGFHPNAWGARGVYVGSDMPSEEWASQIRTSLAEFSSHPRLVQRFIKGAVAEQEFAAENDEIVPLKGRARVCPYYFVVNDRVSLGGVLVTLVPTDKKLIHGHARRNYQSCDSKRLRTTDGHGGLMELSGTTVCCRPLN